jgi:hypothetical protein
MSEMFQGKPTFFSRITFFGNPMEWCTLKGYFIIRGEGAIPPKKSNLPE